MNKLQRLKAWWYKPVEHDADVVPHDDIEPEEFKDLPIFSTDVEVVKLTEQPKGRVIATTHTAYQAGATRTGGRVVKIMPRQLKQMKQAQEKVEDD